MAFSFTTGNPANITGPSTASMNDIKNSFADIKTHLNGRNITAASFDSDLLTPYVTVAKLSSHVIPQSDFYTSGPTFVGHQNFLVRFNVAEQNMAQIIAFDPASYALTGKTLRLRLLVSAVITGAWGPTATFGLYPISSITSFPGAVSVNPGTVVSGSTVAIAGAAGTASYSSGDFAAPSAGAYVFGNAAVSGTANNVVAGLTFTLQARWI